VTEVALRCAVRGDVPWLADLVSHPEVSPFLAAVRAASPAEIAAEIERAERDPEGFGVLVIEAGGEPLGTVTWERVNRRSRIASVSGLALDPRARGRGIAAAAIELLVAELLDARGLHRVQAEVYGFNERGAAFFERAGFVREGVRRLAYWRDGHWVDGVCFGLVAEDRAGESGQRP
jgi:RimJ/RimL family protein N-acetyltransferase